MTLTIFTLVEPVETGKKREAGGNWNTLRRAQGANISLVEPVETRKKREFVETGTPFDRLRERSFPL
tara:strand:- start:1639 stop:1839 length:201 start_codon:yes stop_codon:yes gene_type:complete